VLNYTGVTNTIDLLTLSGSGQIINIELTGFRIASATTMSAGTALHLVNFCRSRLRDVVADGQDGNGNLWNGIWFDRIDMVFCDGFQVVAQNDAIRINGTVGSGPKADLFLANGKIGGAAIGLHIGGAFGGLQVGAVDIIGNNQNVVVDTALASEGNRELFFSDQCMVDSALTGDGYYINDTLAGSGWLSIGGWVASSAGSGIHVIAWAGWISISAGTIFNNRADGIRIDTASPAIVLGTQTVVRSNGGYGVNATVAITQISLGYATFSGNTSGVMSSNVTSNVAFYGSLQVAKVNMNSSSGPNIQAGTGAATGTQPAGSIWIRTDGSTGSRIYVSAGGGTWNAIANV
jgi:hypothetical protein